MTAQPPRCRVVVGVVVQRPGQADGGLTLECPGGDGVHQVGEPFIAGTTVILTGVDANNAAVNLTQTTAADGSYLFANLLSGTYTVTETQPAAYNDCSSSP